jgi:6-phosphogluconolactonase
MRIKRFLTALSSVLLLSCVVLTTAQANGQFERANGAAYTMTNAEDDNQIVVFNRDRNGLLTLEDSVSTGGKGSGGSVDPLASQGSLVLTSDDNHHDGRRHDGEWLLAVNAGSNDVSVFRVGRDGIELQDRSGSGGAMPVSLTVFDDMVYVLNNEAPANITGFKLSQRGRLKYLRHSTRLLGDGDYGQVAFEPRGRALIITDKANNNLLVYRLGRNGLPSRKPVVSPSVGAVPFGVDFDRRGHLLVVEAGTNAVSSYQLLHDGRLRTISASVPNGQVATCWIVVNERGHVITTNPGTNSLSAYRVNPGTGQVVLLNGTAGSGMTPLDIDVSRDGRFAYAVDPTSGGVDMFRIEYDGSLTGLGTIDANLAVYAQGMAVR